MGFLAFRELRLDSGFPRSNGLPSSLRSTSSLRPSNSTESRANTFNICSEKLQELLDRVGSYIVLGGAARLGKGENFRIEVGELGFPKVVSHFRV